MAGALRKTMVYLGLAEEDERYDRYDDYAEPETREKDGERSTADDDSAVRRVEPRSGSYVAGVPAVETEAQTSRPAEVTPLPRRTPVREVVNDVEVSRVHRITTIHPRTYNEAKNIGENFRDGTPVIMNLTDLDDADAKRLVDFAAGLVFGLQGSIERVTNKVFLLSPADVEVTSHEGEPAQGSRLFNQS